MRSSSERERAVAQSGINDLRQQIVAEARAWIGTPYHHLGGGDQVPGRNLKGIGIDCAQILIETFAAAGAIAWFSTGRYPADWMMHRDEERYLSFIEAYASEISASDVLPGDIVVWRYGRTFAHGAIVTAWPMVVHAFAPYRTVSESDVSKPSELTLLNDGRPRPMRAFRLNRL